MGISRRLEALEERSRERLPSVPDRGEARRRVKAGLDRLAELRRSGATAENDPEVAAIAAALKRRREELDRGEAGR